MREAFDRARVHAGYAKLLELLTKEFACDYFVCTSNIDGYFARASFSSDRLYECHGSLAFLQVARLPPYDLLRA
jgi:NAD-dependent SIR2 family protein deacetylase